MTRRAPDLPPRPHLFLRIMPSPGSLPAILASVTGKYSLFPHAPTLSQKRTAHPAFWAIVSCRTYAHRLSLSFTPSCTGLRRTFLRPSPPQLSYRCRPMGNKKDLYLLPDEGGHFCLSRSTAFTTHHTFTTRGLPGTNEPQTLSRTEIPRLTTTLPHPAL